MATNLPATENLPTASPSQATTPLAVDVEKSKKKKILLAVLGLLFILASTPLAVYLVQQRQEIRKEAETGDNPTCVIESSSALNEQATINVKVTSPKEYVTKLIFVPPDGFYDPEDHAEEMLFNYNVSGNCGAITFNGGACHGGSCGEQCSTCDLQFTLSSGSDAGECLFFIKFASDDGSGSCKKTIQIVAPPTPTPCSLPLIPSIGGSCTTASGEGVADSTCSLDWNDITGADYYALRVDDLANGWSGTCSWTYEGDICTDTDASSYSFTGQGGHNYSAWVHAVNQCGWSDPSYTSFIVPYITPTPTPTVTPTPTSTPTGTPTPTFTPTPTITSTPTPTPTPTGTATPTPTSTPTATPTPISPACFDLEGNLPYQPEQLKAGDIVSLTCLDNGHSSYPIVRFEFRMSQNSGSSWQNLNPDNSPQFKDGKYQGQIDYVIPDPPYGCYRFECRPCTSYQCSAWP